MPTACMSMTTSSGPQTGSATSSTTIRLCSRKTSARNGTPSLGGVVSVEVQDGADALAARLRREGVLDGGERCVAGDHALQRQRAVDGEPGQGGEVDGGTHLAGEAADQLLALAGEEQHRLAQLDVD